MEQGREAKACVPFVSEYTDCNPGNECSGCTKCSCTVKGLWECQPVHLCDDAFETDQVDEELLDAAIEKLDHELKSQKLRQQTAANRYVPVPSKKDETEELLEIMNNYKPEQKLKEILRMRAKRSIASKNIEKKHSKRSTDKSTKTRHPRNSNNNTVKFYSTVDELNEDTLKHSNVSGTLHARRVELKTLPDTSRRSNTIDNINKSLHIDFNHITDNKIDVIDKENKFDLSHEQLNMLLSNYTQKTKDKDLSKLVVNELNAGTEIIGDSHAPVTSNITFTSENDTLTAMAFIAGNLLNKLWNMEKDASGFTFETEDMKYEKISGLLDLFKEPLNLRQEMFLKNALEQLSNVIDKDREIKNLTICQTIEDATKLIDLYNNTDVEESPNMPITAEKPCNKINSSKTEKTNKHATIRAISKINDVLELMRKFDNIQKNISLLKNESSLRINDKENYSAPIRNKINTDSLLTKDETSSLNTFGNILDKITKLLLPTSSSKNFENILNHRSTLTKHQNIKENILKMHNIDLNNMTMSAKDKMILDYIKHINSNPDCILNKKHQSLEAKSLPSIEGNILLNLSEFFKIKSFADLISLIRPEKVIARTNIHSPAEVHITTTEPTTVTSTVKTTTKTLSVNEKNKKFASIKEKLKSHLKSIIEDLLELQNGKGVVLRSNIRVADALPCIYKILNAGKDVPYKSNEQDITPDRIVDIFNTLKKEMKEAHTRRSGSVMQVRPKSAVVLERVVKNVVGKSKVQTRRFATIRDRKPGDELNKIMNKIRNVSSIYKNQALYNEVPAAEKFVLLKTLSEDIRNNIIALEAIKQTYQNLPNLPQDQYEDLATFIHNSAANISLDAKVMNKVDKMDVNNHIVDEVDTSNHILYDKSPRKTFTTLGQNGEDDNMKISRNQIINHLIANRMKLYIKTKEAKEFDLNNDMNYNIAKRVLFYLDSGNYNLAHELFKMIIMEEHDRVSTTENSYRAGDFIAPSPKLLDILNRQERLPGLQSFVQFDQPTTPNSQINWMSQDHLIKQLLYIKNMGL